VWALVRGVDVSTSQFGGVRVDAELCHLSDTGTVTSSGYAVDLVELATPHSHLHVTVPHYQRMIAHALSAVKSVVFQELVTGYPDPRTEEYVLPQCHASLN